MEDGFKAKRVLIAGIGLIGGSVAKALKKAGYEHISAYDSDEKALWVAASEGVIAKGYTNVSDTPETDIIICCLPPDECARFCLKAQERLADGGVFVETGGLKLGITDRLAAALTGNRELLSLHPMAGREKSGYANSGAQLFCDSVLILTPTAKTCLNALMWARELQGVFGCSDILELSAKRHDEVIARISHLPHIVALALKAMDKEEGLERFAGGSYKSATRVADINPALWAELFTRNKDNVLESISLLKESLGDFERAIGGEKRQLENLLKEISQSEER